MDVAPFFLSVSLLMNLPTLDLLQLRSHAGWIDRLSTEFHTFIGSRSFESQSRKMRGDHLKAVHTEVKSACGAEDLHWKCPHGLTGRSQEEENTCRAENRHYQAVALCEKRFEKNDIHDFTFAKNPLKETYRDYAETNLMIHEQQTYLAHFFGDNS